MDVLILTIFVSLTLASLGVGLFIWTVRRGTHEHLDHLALLPLEDDETALHPTGVSRRED